MPCRNDMIHTLALNCFYCRTYILCLNDSYSEAGKGKSIKLLPLTFCTARVSLQNKTTKHPSTIKSFVAKLCIFYDNSWQENKQLLKFSKKQTHICRYLRDCWKNGTYFVTKIFLTYCEKNCLFKQWKVRTIFRNRMLFWLVPGVFLDLIDKNNYNSNWKKNIWIQKHAVKVRK